MQHRHQENHCPYCGISNYRVAEHAWRRLGSWVQELERAERGLGEEDIPPNCDLPDSGQGLPLTGRQVHIAELSLLCRRAMGAVRMILDHGLREPPVQFVMPPSITEMW